jgi:hypothetical protein
LTNTSSTDKPPLFASVITRWVNARWQRRAHEPGVWLRWQLAGSCGSERSQGARVVALAGTIGFQNHGSSALDSGPALQQIAPLALQGLGAARAKPGGRMQVCELLGAPGRSMVDAATSGGHNATCGVADRPALGLCFLGGGGNQSEMENRKLLAVCRVMRLDGGGLTHGSPCLAAVWALVLCAQVHAQDAFVGERKAPTTAGRGKEKTHWQACVTLHDGYDRQPAIPGQRVRLLPPLKNVGHLSCVSA